MVIIMVIILLMEITVGPPFAQQFMVNSSFQGHKFNFIIYLLPLALSIASSFTNTCLPPRILSSINYRLPFRVICGFSFHPLKFPC